MLTCNLPLVLWCFFIGFGWDASAATIHLTFKAVNGSASFNGAPPANIDFTVDLTGNTANLLKNGGDAGSDRYLNLKGFVSSNALGFSNVEATTHLSVHIGMPEADAPFTGCTVLIVSGDAINGIFNLPEIGTWDRTSSIGPLLGSATASGALNISLVNGGSLSIFNFENAKPFGNASFQASVVPEGPQGGGVKPSLSGTDGSLRNLTEKELYLETSGPSVLRFRLIATTRFADRQNAPIRDSLLRPGDRLSVEVDPDDPETAVRVVLVRNGTTAEEKDLGNARPSNAPEPSVPNAGQTTGGEQKPGACNNCSQPKVIYQVDPVYTEEARRAKISGTVLLQLVVDIDGLAKNLKVMHGIGFGLDQKAIECLQKWKFAPATKDGRPVPRYATIEVNFRLI